MTLLPGQAGITEAVGLMAKVALLNARRSLAGDPRGSPQEMLAKMAGRRLVALCAIGRARRGMSPTRHGPVGCGVAGLARDAEAASVRIFSGVAGGAVEALGSLRRQRRAAWPKGGARFVEKPRQCRKRAGFRRTGAAGR